MTNMLVNSILRRTPFLWRYADKFSWRGSRAYWEARYATGGNSGAGSYGHLANYKAKVLNDFVELRQIASVIEFGCGDGNQLSLARYPRYIGLDVSKAAITKCATRFHGDNTKEFFIYHPRKDGAVINRFSADLGISLDVFYHLVEDDIFELYMRYMFAVAKKYVVIYSSNYEEIIKYSHVRHRRFTEHVEANFRQWRLIQEMKNPYPISQYGADAGTLADFYFYEKR